MAHVALTILGGYPVLGALLQTGMETKKHIVLRGASLLFFMHSFSGQHGHQRRTANKAHEIVGFPRLPLKTSDQKGTLFQETFIFTCQQSFKGTVTLLETDKSG